MQRRTEGAYLGEDWQFGSKFSGDFGKESVGSLPAHWIFLWRESIVAFSVCASGTVAEGVTENARWHKKCQIHHVHTIFGVVEIYWKLHCMCSLGLCRSYQSHVCRDLVAFCLSILKGQSLNLSRMAKKPFKGRVVFNFCVLRFLEIDHTSTSASASYGIRNTQLVWDDCRIQTHSPHSFWCSYECLIHSQSIVVIQVSPNHFGRSF